VRALVALAVLAVAGDVAAAPAWGRQRPLPAGEHGWVDAHIGAVRGLTVGPIESALHAEAGYGTALGRAALVEARQMGATWVAITPFGRVWDLEGGGVDLVFEAPLEENTRHVLTAVADAHDLGLRVLLVPHLWVESGGWRALIDPGSDAGWKQWAASYREFLLYWAEVAELGQVEMLSVGVELRSWVTTARAASFEDLVADVRAAYGGLLTYSANWDDLDRTAILGVVDVLGVNAFFPLADREGQGWAEHAAGGRKVAAKLAEVAAEWDKPILLTEMGYTTRVDPAVRPWEWPESMEGVEISQAAQAVAYRALLAPLVDAPWCAGFFAWRTYADPGDVSQEPEYGFSPRGKLAELVLRDAYVTTWAADGDPRFAGWAGLSWNGVAGFTRWGAQRARTPGIHAWER
jgi:glycosyl hydrolase family 113